MLEKVRALICPTTEDSLVAQRFNSAPHTQFQRSGPSNITMISHTFEHVGKCWAIDDPLVVQQLAFLIGSNPVRGWPSYITVA